MYSQCTSRTKSDSIKSLAFSITIYLLILGGSIFLCRTWLTSGIDRLAGLMPDDAFYYFKIASRSWLKEGISFDGINTSTGLHPLWLIIVRPFFIGAEPGSMEPVARILLLGLLLYSVASFQVYLFALRTLGKPFALGCGLLAMGAGWNYYGLVEALNGLETALSICLTASFALSVLLYLNRPSYSGSLLISFLGAANFLARSDSLVILLCLYIVLLFSNTERRHLIAIFSGPAVAVAALTTSSLLATGNPLQSSALALPWVIHNNWLYHNPDAAWTKVMEEGISRFVQQLDVIFSNLGALWLVVTLICLPLLAVVVLFFRDRISKEALNAVLTSGGLFVGVIALAFVHGYLRWFGRNWYFVSVVVAVHMLSAASAKVFLDLAGSFAERRRTAVIVGFTAVCGMLLAWETNFSNRYINGANRFPCQRELVKAGKNLGNYIPEGAKVGSFNAGIIAYFSGKNVVNLDGVVNEEAARSIRKWKLGDYMKSQGIEYLVDYPDFWGTPCLDCFGLYMGESFRRASRTVQAKFEISRGGCPRPGSHVELIKLRFED